MLRKVGRVKSRKWRRSQIRTRKRAITGTSLRFPSAEHIRGRTLKTRGFISSLHFCCIFTQHETEGIFLGHEWRFVRVKVFEVAVFIVTNQFISIFQALGYDWHGREGQNSSFLLAKEEKLLWWYLFHAWLKLNRILFLFSFHEGLTPDQIGKTRVACFSEGNEKESLGELKFGGIKYLEAL